MSLVAKSVFISDPKRGSGGHFEALGGKIALVWGGKIAPVTLKCSNKLNI